MEIFIFSSIFRLQLAIIRNEMNKIEDENNGKQSKSDFPKSKMAFQDRNPFQPCLPIHAMLNFLKIYRTEQNFTGHVLGSCGFPKVCYIYVATKSGKTNFTRHAHVLRVCVFWKV